MNFEKESSWIYPPVSNIDEMKIRRDARKMENYIEDAGRNREKVVDVVQLNYTGLFDVVIKEVATDRIRTEEVQLDSKSNVLVDNDSNRPEREREDTIEENSLLSLPIPHEKRLRTWNEMNDESSSEEEEVKLEKENYDNDDNIGCDMNMEANEYEMEENEDDYLCKKNGVKERFKSMISEGLGSEHWDKEELMCLTTEVGSAEQFAEEIVEGININEDLKLNLQQAIHQKGLKFKLIIANKRNQVVKGEQNSIQRLLYLSEKRKKKDEIKNE